MTTWIYTVYYEVNTFYSLESGESIWFADMEDYSQYQDNIFPFTLPSNHPNFQRPREILRPGLLPPYSLNDIQKFATETSIAVDRLMEKGQEPVALEMGPTLVYRPLRCSMEVSVSLHEAADATGSCYALAYSLAGPFDMEMETPLFTDFRIRLIADKKIKFSKPVEICISLDGYSKFDAEVEAAMYGKS